MKQTNWTIMAKGGVGKSFVTWVLAQYHMKNGRGTYFADTDPSNATFSSYPGIAAKHINIADAQSNIDQGAFDVLVNDIVNHDGYSVIDTGAPAFLSLMNYLSSNDTFGGLQSIGHQVIVHTPLVGGPAMEETLMGISAILESTTANVVVWENEYFGKAEVNGVRFANTKLYSKYRDRILGIVNIPQREEKTFGKDIKNLLSQRLMFDACDGAEFPFAQKHRINAVRRALFEQLDAIGI